MNNYFTSTIFRKILAALSGLFLTLFLFGHLAGNLQLFISGVEGQTQFNKYALFMTTNPAVKLLSILTYSSILLHVILTLYLAFKSRQARPIGYAVSSGNSNSSWSSNNMAILGTFLLLFIIVHMRSFWYEMHFGEMPYQYLEDGTKIKDLYLITTSAFNNPLYTLFYIISMIALALHLNHGVSSAVQTIGLKLPNYEKPLKYVAGFIALIIPATFASIPIYLYIRNLQIQAILIKSSSSFFSIPIIQLCCKIFIINSRIAKAGKKYIIIVNLFLDLSFFFHESSHSSLLHTGGILSRVIGFQHIEQCL